MRPSQPALPCQEQRTNDKQKTRTPRVGLMAIKLAWLTFIVKFSIVYLNSRIVCCNKPERMSKFGSTVYTILGTDRVFPYYKLLACHRRIKLAVDLAFWQHYMTFHPAFP